MCDRIRQKGLVEIHRNAYRIVIACTEMEMNQVQDQMPVFPAISPFLSDWVAYILLLRLLEFDNSQHFKERAVSNP